MEYLKDILCGRQNFGNLRGINRRLHAAIDDLQLAASRLICDRRYLSLYNFAAVEADPDAGAYDVVHIAHLDLPPKTTRRRWLHISVEA